MQEAAAQAVLERVEARRDELVELLRELIRRPSPSGEEEPAACFAVEQMQRLGMRASIDRVGNAVGTVGPEEPGGLLLTAHLDHVPPGEMPDPYEGKLLDGAVFGVEGPVVYGRGASGQKAALAAMLAAVQAVRESGAALARPVLIAGTVLEEPGGEVGVRELVEGDGLRPDWAIVGENTNLDVYLGHRGITTVRITTLGVSSHAAAPERGVSALTMMAKVLLAAERWREELPSDPVLGRAGFTINNLTVVPNATNVIPERCVAIADARTLPSFSGEQVVAFVEERLAALAREDERFRYQVELATRRMRTWTGLEVESHGGIQGFATDPEHPLARTMVAAARLGRGSEPALGYWRAASDGGYLSTSAGIPCVGFGAGEARFSHTSQDHVRVDDLLAAAKSYAAAIVALCASRVET